MSGRDLKTLAAQGAEVFLSVLPRVALGGILGSIKWMFALGAFGAVLALATWWMWSGADIPSWLPFSLLLTPLVLSIAGIYVGALRGVLEALARQMSERKLIAYVYAQVKPAAVAALKALPTGNAHELAESTRAGMRRLFEEEQEAQGKPLSFGDKLARSVSTRVRRLLAASAADYIGSAKSHDEALAKVEDLGIAKLEEIAADTLKDLFSLHITIVLGLSLVASLLPQIGWWLSR